MVLGMITTAESSASPGIVSTRPAVRSVEIAGPAGRLEGLLNTGSGQARFAALVCHPHPLGGGNLHNKVVFHTMKVLNDPAWGFAFPVLRFNFRGTGLSQGEHHGEDEAGDVLAALDWLADEYSRPVIVAGFSFGAVMSLAACCARDSKAKALAAIGLPVRSPFREYSYASFMRCTLPKLFLSGDRDQYAPAKELEALFASAAAPKQFALIPHADHFFTGQLGAMQRALALWLKEHAP